MDAGIKEEKCKGRGRASSVSTGRTGRNRPPHCFEFKAIGTSGVPLFLHATKMTGLMFVSLTLLLSLTLLKEEEEGENLVIQL